MDISPTGAIILMTVLYLPSSYSQTSEIVCRNKYCRPFLDLIVKITRQSDFYRTTFFLVDQAPMFFTNPEVLKQSKNLTSDAKLRFFVRILFVLDKICTNKQQRKFAQSG